MKKQQRIEDLKVFWETAGEENASSPQSFVQWILEERETWTSLEVVLGKPGCKQIKQGFPKWMENSQC